MSVDWSDLKNMIAPWMQILQGEPCLKHVFYSPEHDF